MPDPLSWLLILICLIGSFFFSASETAIACCNRYKMQVKADNGSKAAKVVIKLCNKYDRTLTTVLIGNNIVAIAISALSTVLFLKYFNAVLNDSAISLISSIIMTFVVYILGDTLPKTIAKAIPDTLSIIFAYPIYGLMIILYPITLVFDGISKLIVKIFKVKDDNKFSEEDFENAVEKASKDENIEEEQVEMVQSALDFMDTKVAEVLTPRERIFAINIKGLTHQNLQEMLINCKYSRIPIYDKVFDNVIGILNTKVYFEEYCKDPHVDIRSILQRPYFTNKNVMIDDLFQGFKKKHTHLSLVRDSHKYIIGMVTMEDVLEELVEDIAEPTIHRGNK